MEQSFSYTFLKNLTNSYRIAIILSSSVLISLLMPQIRTVSYDYDIGAKWKYNDLRAPYDFAIKKSDSEKQKEKQEIEKTMPPYYSLVTKPEEILTEQVLDVYTQYQNQVKGDSGLFLNTNSDNNIKLLVGLLKKQYEKGIIEVNQLHKDQNNDFLIDITDGNTLTLRPLKAIDNMESARLKLSGQLYQVGKQTGDYLSPLLASLLEPNLFYDESLTLDFLNQSIENISPNKGYVKKGDIVVNKNTIVTKDIYQKLTSLEERYDAENKGRFSYAKSFLAHFVLITMILMFYILYVRTYVREVYLIFKKMLFMNLWIVIYAVFAYFVIRSNSLDLLMIPFCIAPIVIKNFYNQRLAFFTLITILLVVGLYGSVSKDFLIMNTIAGIMVVIVTRETRYWSKFFLMLLLLLVVYIVSYLLLLYIKNNNLYEFNLSSIWWICLNVFLTLLAYPLIPLLERLFGFTSNITLSALSDLNNELLKELSIKAPGTFQHSLHVATLAEAAAEKIGANSTLAKVGALYHDIGKTKHPFYFTENQNQDNPHDRLEYAESAKIIIEHVTEGVRIGKKYGLPGIIIAFISTHHGTTKAEYFYRKFIQDHPDKQVDEKVFTYPGPKPKTKEQVIVMLADTCEAAVKSMNNPTEHEIETLVDKLINGKIESGQLDRSEITFEDVEMCSRIFKKMLVNMNHVRIVYPDAEKEDRP